MPLGLLAGAGAQLLQRQLGQLAVAGKLTDGEVDAAVDLVGHAAADELLDLGQHLGDVLGGARLQVGGQAVEGLVVGVVLAGPALGERRGVLAGLAGAGDDLVVDVGDVAHERHLIAARPQVAGDHIEGDQRPRVADVKQVVDRWAADIHPDLARAERLEGHLALQQGVVDCDDRPLGGIVCVHACTIAGALLIGNSQGTRRRSGAGAGPWAGAGQALGRSESRCLQESAGVDTYRHAWVDIGR